MDSSHPVNLDDISNQLGLDRARVQVVVELLEEGNTVPFVTRFRKDKSGGLDEQQVRAIQLAVSRQRQLVERRQTVLKSIESQEKLTDSLRSAVESAKTVKQLEDIYLPYKPKKKTLATVARQRGLEPFARQIIERDQSLTSLETRANEFVDPEKELPTVDDVLQGVGHLVAEHISELVGLREELRKLLRTEGVLTSKRLERTADEIAAEEEAAEAEFAAASSTEASVAEASLTAASSAEANSTEVAVVDTDATDDSTAEIKPDGPTDASIACAAVEETDDAAGSSADASAGEIESNPAESQSEPPEVSTDVSADATEHPTAVAVAEQTSVEDNNAEPDTTDTNGTAESTVQAQPCAPPTTDSVAEGAGTVSPVSTAAAESKLSDSAEKAGKSARKSGGKKKADATKLAAATSRRIQRREARKRKREKLEQSFKDYFNFREPVTKIRHHRILAINRGERTKVLRVRIEVPAEKLQEKLEATLEIEKHPHADFFLRSAQDALNRLLVPSLEREVRRELSDRAEEHAVDVFARNLRALLLQPPIRGKRVLAIDPGFRSGCKLVALDEFGNFLADTLIHLIGKDDRTKLGRERLVEMVKTHRIDLLAIGNGTACRESERLVADVLSKELVDARLPYIIVNEAGASVYSTSNAGRTEHPKMDPTVRSAVSIGRRTIDPLSELVKIDPASIGVGLYQHDVKSKHLRESLDAVVESCVNFVGVDVNSASPALLARLSGLNQLTAKRIYEYRQRNGPFLTRQQLMDVPGIGEATFVQAAGFLKIVGGENPLDGTWIHPESYGIAQRILEAIDCSAEQLRPRTPLVSPAEPPKAEPPKAESPTAESPTAEPPKAESPTAESPTAESPTADALPAEPPADASLVVQTPEVVEAIELPNDSTSDQLPADAGTDGAAVVSQANSSPAEVGEPTATQVTDAATAGDSPAVASSVTSDATIPDTPAECSQADTLADRIASINVDELATKLGVGRLLLEDILFALARPGHDPREDFPAAVFRHGILKLEDLRPGMELNGTVLNVVDFGAFVDIGMNDSGLIHVSRLADTFVSDPHEVVSVGDVLRVWVIDVDNQRRRVSLTAIEPGTEKPRPPKAAVKSSAKPRQRPQKKRSAAPEKDGRARRHQHGSQKRDGKRWQPKAKPKPVVPITEDMADGKAPMRTFGDLKQFFERQVTDDSGKVESGQVESGQVESGQVESGQVESGQVESGQVESGQVESGQVESGQVESGQVESGQVESGKVESGKVESGQVESGKVESGVDALSTDNSK